MDTVTYTVWNVSGYAIALWNVTPRDGETPRQAWDRARVEVSQEYGPGLSLRRRGDSTSMTYPDSEDRLYLARSQS